MKTNGLRNKKPKMARAAWRIGRGPDWYWTIFRWHRAVRAPR
jgi:hypothetical protein